MPLVSQVEIPPREPRPPPRPVPPLDSPSQPPHRAGLSGRAATAGCLRGSRLPLSRPGRGSAAAEVCAVGSRGLVPLPPSPRRAVWRGWLLSAAAPSSFSPSLASRGAARRGGGGIPLPERGCEAAAGVCVGCWRHVPLPEKDSEVPRKVAVPLRNARGAKALRVPSAVRAPGMPPSGAAGRGAAPPPEFTHPPPPRA